MKTWVTAAGVLSLCALTAVFTNPAQLACAALILGLLLTALVVATQHHGVYIAEASRVRPPTREGTDRSSASSRTACLVVNRR